MVTININLNAHILEAQLSNVTSAIYHGVHTMSAKFDELVAVVHEQTTVVDSVLALIDKLEQDRDNPTELQATIDELVANKTRMANAVASDTGTTEPPTA